MCDFQPNGFWQLTVPSETKTTSQMHYQLFLTISHVMTGNLAVSKTGAVPAPCLGGVSQFPSAGLTAVSVAKTLGGEDITYIMSPPYYYDPIGLESVLEYL